MDGPASTAASARTCTQGTAEMRDKGQWAGEAYPRVETVFPGMGQGWATHTSSSQF